MNWTEICWIFFYSHSLFVKMPDWNFWFKDVCLYFRVRKLAKSPNSFSHVWEFSMLCCLTISAIPFVSIVWIWIKVGRGNSCGFHCLDYEWLELKLNFDVADRKKVEMLMVLGPFGEDDYLTRFIILAPKFALSLWFIPQSFKTL